jgi:hypothetical protein
MRNEAELEAEEFERWRQGMDSVPWYCPKVRVRQPEGWRAIRAIYAVVRALAIVLMACGAMHYRELVASGAMPFALLAAVLALVLIAVTEGE